MHYANPQMHQPGMDSMGAQPPHLGGPLPVGYGFGRREIILGSEDNIMFLKLVASERLPLMPYEHHSLIPPVRPLIRGSQPMSPSELPDSPKSTFDELESIQELVITASERLSPTRCEYSHDIHRHPLIFDSSSAIDVRILYYSHW